MQYIDTKQAFDDFLEKAARSSILAIDTEFLREKTYYPKLCLIQIATDDDVFVLDPLSGINVSGLAALLEDAHIMKVFHAASQDIEILLHATGVMPTPLFDTQVAASFLGHTQQMGLGALVHAFCGVTLKKGDSFTDWAWRPLTDSQIKYAVEDVVFLPELYETMCALLRERDRLAWLEDELREIADISRYEIDPAERFKKLKRVNQLSGKTLAAAQQVAAWRERTAQQRDIPRRWVLTDEQIVEACRREAKTIDDLYMVRGMREKLGCKDAREVAGIMRAAYQSDPSTWPHLDHQRSSEENVDSALDLMLSLVRIRAHESGVAMQTLAPHADLVALARGYEDDTCVMKGWRRQIIGNELIELLQGKISLKLDDNALCVVKNS